MLADTSAIDAYGAAQSRHAAGLDAITARLTSASGGLTTDALGPVGARFLAALDEALVQERRRLAALGAQLGASAHTAAATAEGYRAAEGRAGETLTGLGT